MLHNPDVIFLPDDLIYLNLAPKFKETTDALLLFVSVYIRPEEVLPIKNQGGVLCDGPISKFIDDIRKITPIQSVGVVAGPENFDVQAIEKIKTDLLKSGVSVEIRPTTKWSEYIAAFHRFEETKDGIWPMVPCGVVDDDGKGITDREFGTLIENSRKITMDYAWRAAVKHAMFLGIDPKLLGARSAHIGISFLKGGQPAVERFNDYTLHISETLVKKLNLKIPVEFIGYVEN